MSLNDGLTYFYCLCISQTGARTSTELLILISWKTLLCYAIHHTTIYVKKIRFSRNLTVLPHHKVNSKKSMVKNDFSSKNKSSSVSLRRSPLVLPYFRADKITVVSLLPKRSRLRLDVHHVGLQLARTVFVLRCKGSV